MKARAKVTAATSTGVECGSCESLGERASLMPGAYVVTVSGGAVDGVEVWTRIGNAAWAPDGTLRIDLIALPSRGSLRVRLPEAV